VPLDFVKVGDYDGDPVFLSVDEVNLVDGQAPDRSNGIVQLVKLAAGPPGEANSFDPSVLASNAGITNLAALLGALSSPAGGSVNGHLASIAGSVDGLEAAFASEDSTMSALLAATGATGDSASASTVIGRLKALVAALGGTLTTAPTSSGDMVGTLAQGRKVVTSPGSPVALVGSSTPCKWVSVTALKSNSDRVHVGGSGVLAAEGTETGEPLDAGEGVSFPVANAQLVFVDSRAAGEGVTFTVGS
jgi:hypothetical protein